MRTVELLSSFAFGRIPFIDTLASPLPAAYTDFAESSKLKAAAIDLLFLSGNTPVDIEAVFATADNLRTFVATKNYRGLLALQGIAAEIPDNGVMRLRFHNLLSPKQEIGYTPYRVRLLGRHRVFHHAPGDGVRRPPVVLSDGTSVLLSHQVSFRVGWIARLASRILTGSWAPFAWMRVEYFFQRTGTYTITLTGSCVPTQTWLLASEKGERVRIHGMGESSHLDLPAQSRPKCVHTWDMLESAVEAVEAFISARNPSGDEAYSITIAGGDDTLTIGDDDANA